MLETSDFIANTPKHVLDKIKGQKHSLRRRPRKSLFSEQKSWKQRNLAQKKRKESFEKNEIKISMTRWKLVENLFPVQ